MAKKKLRAVEAASPKVTALEDFCISVIAVLRQHLKTSDNVLVCQGTKVPQRSRLK